MKHVSALIKPASSLCQLRCRYCFYCDVAAHRELPSFGIMEDHVARALIDRLIDAADEGGTVQFSFQGGEPTLAGVDFFRRFTAYADERNAGKCILSYAIQTNGIALSDGDGGENTARADDFCRLLARHHFLVGLSLDGDEVTHNLNRVDAAGQGTHKRVMQAARRLRKYGIDFNVLSVVTETMARHPRAVFRFYMKNGFDYLQFIPCLEPLEGAAPAAYTLNARTYSDFLIATFRLWKEELMRGHAVSIRLFDNILGMYLGRLPEQCGVYGRCQNQLVVEGDGSVYPCDFYVLDEFSCGHVLHDTVEQLQNGPRAKRFLTYDPPPSPRCEGCRFMPMCGGTCKRYRDFYASVPDFCPYEHFLTQVGPDIAELVRMVKRPR